MAFARSIVGVLLLAVPGSLFTACGQFQLPEPIFSARADTDCSTSQASFYPAAVFAHAQSNGEQDAVWYSRILESMSEPRLSCGPVTESYRFVWLPSFSNWSPTAVRITLEDQKWTIVAVRLSNAIDRKVAERKERELTDQESQRALAAVSEFGFWIKSGSVHDPDVMDGSTWIVEGRRETAYHAVVRGNVDEAALRRMALLLFQLSGMDPGPVYQPGSTNGSIRPPLMDHAD